MYQGFHSSLMGASLQLTASEGFILTWYNPTDVMPPMFHTFTT